MVSKIKVEQISAICVELYMLLHAGLSTGDAMNSVADANPSIGVLRYMADKVDQGETLSSCFLDAGIFPKYVTGLVKVGEESGKIEESLKCLGDYYENQAYIEHKVKSVILYPVMIATLMLIVVGVILTMVLPMFDSVYASLGAELSGLSSVFLSIGIKIKKYTPVLLTGIAMLLTLALVVLFVPPLTLRAKQVFQKLHGDKGISFQLNNSKIAQAISLGITSGMNIEDAVKLSSDIVDGHAKDRCLMCNKILNRGETLADALLSSKLLPPEQCKILELGERGGFLDESIVRVSRVLTENANIALDNLVSKIEPTLVLISSLLIGTILLSVVFPLMEVMSSIW